MGLSAKNGWLDGQGRVYIIFPVQEVMDALGCADNKATKLFRELEKFGLIERKRRGLGKPNLIYVKNFADPRFRNREKNGSGAADSAQPEAAKSRGNKTEWNKTEGSEPDPFSSDAEDEPDERTRLEAYFVQSLEVDLLLRACPDEEDTIQEIRDATMYDELELDKLGDRKTALFLIMSDTDSTFNFLISMIYTQLFNLLCDKADDQYGGKLPVHVRCLIDECANIGQIPQLEKLVATIRSREISACLVLQTRSQLKAIYKDNADTIVGNMDSQIFLGGSEPTTLKELSEALGRETIDSFNTSDTRGNSPSYGTSFQKLGHELMSRDKLAVLDGGKCILQLRGVRPFLSDKYDLTQHPNYKLTADYDPKNTFDIEKYLHPKIKILPNDAFVVVDADSLPPV